MSRKTMDYGNGKIYRLISSNGLQYIGSTTQPLCKRMAKHRNHYKRYCNGSHHFLSCFKLFDEDAKVEICLLENYPCVSKEELYSRERYWIENIENGCVNINIPTRTKHERYVLDRENLINRTKEWKQNHKEQNKNWQMELIVCECGCSITRSHISTHKKSNKHKKLMTTA